MDRELPNNSEKEQAFVARWVQRVSEAKTYWRKDFNRIRDDQNFVHGEQWPDDPSGEVYYVANITLRHIAQRTSALYAKNPKAVASVKERMDYVAWDGDADTAHRAEETLMLVQQNFPGEDPAAIAPAAAAVKQEYDRVTALREQRRRLAKTLELAYQHQVDEQVHPFKKQMKRVVRRTGISGVGYVKLGFQRVSEMAPDVQRQLDDYKERLAHIEMLAADIEDGEYDRNSAEAEELQQAVRVLQEQEEVLLREGVTFDYPDSTSVIPDQKCRNLDGFVGADWIAIEYGLSPDDIKEIYDVDVSRSSAYTVNNRYGQFQASASITLGKDGDRDVCRAEVLVWEVYDRKTRTVFTIAEGYPGYLRAPAAPVIDIERFWPVYTLMFNETDHPKKIFPPSDVRLMRQMQLEHNSQRQHLRMHRIANRPKYVVAGPLEEEDRHKLETHPFNAIIELAGLVPGQKVDELLQPLKMVNIDPNVYSTAEVFEDILRVMGTQEANLGGTSNATATESSIAESSRLSSLQSNVDDLDEFLTEIARTSGQVMLREMDPETIRRIVGEGAVWPQLTREEIVEEVYLTVEAGSSGRPNQAQQIQNAERLYPLLLQVPGVRPEFLVKDLLRRLDDRFDLVEAFDNSLPSITALNGLKQLSTGDPTTDPNAQGAQGASNTAQPGGVPGDQGRPAGPPLLPALPA